MISGVENEKRESRSKNRTRVDGGTRPGKGEQSPFPKGGSIQPGARRT